jgi:hypothetical protein
MASGGPETNQLTKQPTQQQQKQLNKPFNFTRLS